MNINTLLTLMIILASSFLAIAMESPFELIAPVQLEEIDDYFDRLIETELIKEVSSSLPAHSSRSPDKYDDFFTSLPAEVKKDIYSLFQNTSTESQQFKKSVAQANLIIQAYTHSPAATQPYEIKHICPYCGAACLDFTHFAAHCHSHEPRLSSLYKCLDLSQK